MQEVFVKQALTYTYTANSFPPIKFGKTANYHTLPMISIGAPLRTAFPGFEHLLRINFAVPTDVPLIAVPAELSQICGVLSKQGYSEICICYSFSGKASLPTMTSLVNPIEGVDNTRFTVIDNRLPSSPKVILNVLNQNPALVVKKHDKKPGSRPNTSVKEIQDNLATCSCKTAH